MSKYSEQMERTFKDTGRMKKLTEELKNKRDKKLCQKEIDKTLSEVIKGKWKRRFK